MNTVMMRIVFVSFLFLAFINPVFGQVRHSAKSISAHKNERLINVLDRFEKNHGVRFFYLLVKGIDTPVEFSVMPITQIKERTPSLKSSLYWDANVTLKKNSPYVGQLQTSDDVGEYIISFSGIDEKGIPIKITKRFMVKYSVE